ncbi:MAG TPA: DUF2344 domain-containing protein [Candidatus Limnocylindrales bacterium]|nr:DUF2344 domain-containing protein [Candidatus Limnocylindrales bacterium]
MERPSDGPPTPPAEVRQRWRITFAREPVPAEQVGRAGLDAWQAALAASGLPVAGLEPGGTGRARISLAAPLAAPFSGEAELADLYLLERRLVWQVREALDDRLPSGHRWVGAEDVWVGSPPLPGRVVAADWRVDLGSSAPDGERLAAAVRSLVDARELPRVRAKGGSEKPYDLRPLLMRLDVAGPATVRIRTRIHPELGSGRPEEVVAALADACRTELEPTRITRTGLVLAEDLARRLKPGVD